MACNIGLIGDFIAPDVGDFGDVIVERMHNDKFVRHSKSFA